MVLLDCMIGKHVIASIRIVDHTCNDLLDFDKFSCAVIRNVASDRDLQFACKDLCYEGAPVAQTRLSPGLLIKQSQV